MFQPENDLTRVVSLALARPQLSPEQPGTLALLLEVKNRQWSRCLEQRDFEQGAPPGGPWFGQMADRLRSAVQRDGAVVLSAEDIRLLVQLVRWVERRTPHLMQGVPRPSAEGIADDAELRIEGEDLTIFLGRWHALEGWLAGQRDRAPYARDLFERPSPLPFADWRNNARQYWP